VYNAYSIDGDVTGDLVYANYGIPADYAVLERNGCLLYTSDAADE